MNTKRQSKTKFQVRSFLNSWLPTFTWIIVVFYLSLADSGLPEIKFRFILESDKIAHLVIYSVLNFLLLRSWSSVFSAITTNFLLIFASLQAISFSIIMEVLQKYLTSTRQFDMKDIYANIGGTIAGAVIYLLYHRFFSRNTSDNKA
jgi:glycopeptide antibiotics resistance protein